MSLSNSFIALKGQPGDNRSEFGNIMHIQKEEPDMSDPNLRQKGSLPVSSLRDAIKN